MRRQPTAEPPRSVTALLVDDTTIRWSCSHERAVPAAEARARAALAQVGCDARQPLHSTRSANPNGLQPGADSYANGICKVTQACRVRFHEQDTNRNHEGRRTAGDLFHPAVIEHAKRHIEEASKPKSKPSKTALQERQSYVNLKSQNHQPPEDLGQLMAANHLSTAFTGVGHADVMAADRPRPPASTSPIY